MQRDTLDIEFLRYTSKEQAIYEQLRRGISSGTLRPGLRLLPKALAQQYRVSSMPIRNALMRLEAEQLVTRDPHRQFLVSEYSSTEIRELYEIRANLEGMAARLGARRVTAEQLLRLQEILERAENHIQRGEFRALMEANTEFHDQIYRHAGNQQLLNLIYALRDRADRYRATYSGIPEFREDTLQEHREILLALERGDADAVGAIIEKFTRKTSGMVQRLLNAQGSTKDGLQSLTSGAKGSGE